MKTAFMKKIIVTGLAVFMAPALLLVAPTAKADSSSKPSLYNVTDKTTSSVLLPFKYKKFKNEKVDVIVSVKKRSTGDIMERHFQVLLDKKGKGAVTVANLSLGTKYDFKIRMKKVSSDSYTDNSKKRTASTRN